MGIYYDIYDVADYSSCPYKLTFKHKDEDKKIFENTISNLTKDLCLFYIGKKFLNKPISIYGLNSKLNKLWDLYKKNKKVFIGKNKKRDKIEELMSVKNRINFINDLVQEEENVLAFDYEFKFRIDSIIIKGKCLAISELNNTYRIIIMPDNSPINDVKDNYHYLTIGNYFYLAALQEFEGITDNIVVDVINTYKGIVYRPILKSRQDIEEYFRTLIKGIENELFYPRPSYYTCKYNCDYRKQCKWKIQH